MEVIPDKVEHEPPPAVSWHDKQFCPSTTDGTRATRATRKSVFFMSIDLQRSLLFRQRPLFNCPRQRLGEVATSSTERFRYGLVAIPIRVRGGDGVRIFYCCDITVIY